MQLYSVSGPRSSLKQALRGSQGQFSATPGSARFSGFCLLTTGHRTQSLRKVFSLFGLLAGLWFCWAEANAQPLAFTGVNLAGGEFGKASKDKAGLFGKDFTYPTVAEFNYFQLNGCNVIRLPFLWERLQPDLDRRLDAAETARLRSVVRQATGVGLKVILDVHNYARYFGKVIGSTEVPEESFAAFWKLLAMEFKPDRNVMFGLMNEPHDMPGRQWLSAANAAIAAIRAAGATNLILVPGNSWTGAHSWASGGADGNSVVMLGVRDPGSNFIFEVHQYLDRDSSGTQPLVVSATIGSERLTRFTQWCKEHRYRALLGEFGAPPGELSKQAVQDMLGYMEKNSDVWTGFTWWAAGPWWGEYMFSLEPRAGKDAPQLDYLRPHLQRR
jgi:endoglucanase